MAQNLGMQQSNFRGKLIAKQSYLKEQEKSQINNLNLHISQPEKEKRNLNLVERSEQKVMK